MISRFILFIHTLIFLSYVGLSIAAPLIAVTLSWGIALPLLLGTILFCIAVITSWKIWGECPFTIWENSWRKKEGRRTYRGACSQHYARVLGWSVADGLTTRILEVLPLIPIGTLLVKLFA